MVQTKSLLPQRFHKPYDTIILRSFADGTPSKSVTPCICLMGHADRWDLRSGGRVETGSRWRKLCWEDSLSLLPSWNWDIHRSCPTRWAKPEVVVSHATKIKVNNHFPPSPLFLIAEAKTSSKIWVHNGQNKDSKLSQLTRKTQKHCLGLSVTSHFIHKDLQVPGRRQTSCPL